MADTEQTNETEVTADAEEATGAGDTAAAEETSEATEAVAAEETGGEEAAVEQSASAEAEPAEAPEAADESPAEAEPAAEATAEPAAEAPVAEEATAAPTEEATEETADASDAPAAEEAAPAAAETASAVEYSYDSLKDKTVVQLREIAESLGDHDALHGYTTMHKEELLVALCTALGVEAHEHHEVVGIDKAAVKAKIRDLKGQRAALIEAGDAKQLKIVRRRIRSLKRKIHKATV